MPRSEAHAVAATAQAGAEVATAVVGASPRPSAKPATTPIEDFAAAHEALEDAFTTERHDGAWGMEARSALDAKLLRGLSVTTAIRSIDRRSTLCRIESTHEGYQRQRRS